MERDKIVEGIEQEAAMWIVQEDFGQLTLEEVNKRDAWLAEDERHREAYSRYKAMWKYTHDAFAPVREVLAPRKGTPPRRLS